MHFSNPRVTAHLAYVAQAWPPYKKKVLPDDLSCSPRGRASEKQKQAVGFLSVPVTTAKATANWAFQDT